MAKGRAAGVPPVHRTQSSSCTNYGMMANVAKGFVHKHTAGLGPPKMEGSPAIKKNSGRLPAAFRRSIG